MVIALISGFFIQGLPRSDAYRGEVYQSEKSTKTIPNTAFQSGETLKYIMRYGWIKGGVASLQIKEKELNGRKIYHAKALARSIGITDKLYPVRDIYESYIDAKTGLPLKAIRNVREENYKDYNEVTFNHHKNTVNSQKSGEHNVPDNIHDMLSAFYFARRVLFNNLIVGDVIKIDTYFCDEVFTLEIRYKGLETIKTKVGKINCFKFSPVVEVGRVFDTEDDLSIWISNDNNFIPVRVQFDLFIGSLKCDLIEYSGLKNNFAKI